jgi:molybdate transport system substrate-binding protein
MSVVFLFCGASSHAPGADGKILVSAAASLKNAFEEIGPLFEKNTGMQVSFNFGGSGLLQKQIEAGAPVDVFASAGEKQMNDLHTKGLIFSETKRSLAENTLVLITRMRSPLQLHSFSDLLKPEIDRLAIGNPKTVPAGQYAEEALRHLNLWDRLQPRLIMAENVRQVLDYVVRGEVQAGIVYASDAPIARGKVAIAATAPEGSHERILYPIAIVKDTGFRRGAQQFINFVIGDTGLAILEKYGFKRPR